MKKSAPRTALESLGRPRFLISQWPWRAAGYVLSTPFVGFAAAIPMAILASPFLIVLAWSKDRPILPNLGAMAFLTLLAIGLLAAFGPLVAGPLAAVERPRLKLVDPRPLTVVPERDPVRWLRNRYTTAAGWREFAYACVLVTVLPLLYAVVTVVLTLLAGWISSPFLVSEGQVSIGFAKVSSAAEAMPWAIAGLLLLPVVPYLWTLLAAGHGAIARVLLDGGPADQLRTELVEVTRSRARLVGAFEAERRRIERDLHDGAQQKLVGLTLQLGMAKLDVPKDSPAAAAVADAHEQAKDLMAQLRELIRGIHPRVLTDRGLPAATRELAGRAPLPVSVDADLPARPPTHLEATAYFVVAEALTNIAKHSGAGQATVSVREHAGVLAVEVTDDGHGGADPHAGGGLTGLADRVAVVDGRMFLSSPVGGPTVVRVEMPWRRSGS